MLFEDRSMDAILAGIRKERELVETQLEDINEELKDYYEGRQFQEGYIADYGFKNNLGKTDLPMVATNLTKKIINKISLTYKYQPERYIISGEERKNDLNEWFAFNEQFGIGYKYAERYKNLLGKVLHRVHFDARRKEWRSYIETIYEPHFIADEDPLTPFAYSYPYKQVLSPTGDIKEDWWIFWSDEQMFYYIPESNRIKPHPDFPEYENPFKIIPMAELRKEYPVDQYECLGALDLIKANQNINIALNNLNLMIHFQAFDQLVITGAQAEDIKRIKTGTQEAIVSSTPDTSYSLLNYQPKINECIEAIRTEIQMIAYVYDLKIAWSIDASPASGFSLLVQNIDLAEKREDDVELAKLHEKKMYKIISTMQDYYRRFRMIDPKEPKLDVNAEIMVDFEESLRLPIQQGEELEMRNWEIEHNTKTPLDYMDSDLTPEERLEKFYENKKINGNLSAAEQIRNNLEQRGVGVEPAQ